MSSITIVSVSCCEISIFDYTRMIKIMDFEISITEILYHFIKPNTFFIYKTNVIISNIAQRVVIINGNCLKGSNFY